MGLKRVGVSDKMQKCGILRVGAEDAFCCFPKGPCQRKQPAVQGPVFGLHQWCEQVKAGKWVCLAVVTFN